MVNFSKKFDKKQNTIADDKIHYYLETLNIKNVKGIKHLSGGYRNHNIKLSFNDQKPIMLKISNNSPKEFKTEMGLIKSIQEKITVPKIIKCDVNNKIALMEFIEGNTLEEVEDSLQRKEIEKIGREIGIELSKIHNIKFNNFGFFNEEVIIPEQSKSFYDGFYEHVDSCFDNELLKQRLDEIDFKKLKEYLFDNRNLIKELKQTNSLVHSDFNQKNIMVNKEKNIWSLSGILDWEFSFSGCPLIDFANFFRFKDEMPKAYLDSITQSYTLNGGELENNWEAKIKMLDILSMLSFLTRDGEYPKTFLTAKSIIKSTI